MAGEDFRRRTTRGGLASIATYAVSTPLSILASALVARSLGPDGQGTLASYQFALTLLLAIGDFGVGAVLLQRSIAARVSGDAVGAVRALRLSLGQRLVMQCPLAVGVIVPWVLLGGSGGVAAILVLLAIPAQQLALQPGLFFNTQNNLGAPAVASILGNVVGSALTVVAAWISGDAAITLAVRLGTALAGLTFTYLLVRAVPLVILLPDLRLKGLWADRAVAFPLWAATLLGLITYSRSEVLFLSGVGRATEAGIFAVAFGVAQQVTSPIDSLSGLLLVSISEARASDERRGVRFALFASRASGAALGLVCCMAPALAWGMAALYGRRFTDAAFLLLPLLLASCAQSLVHPVHSTVLSSLKTRGLLLTNLGGVITDLVGLVVLVPLLGALGAALANMSAQLVAIALLLALGLAHAKESRRFFLESYRPWILAAVTCACTWLLGRLFGATWVGLGVAPLVTALGLSIVNVLIWGALLQVLPKFSSTKERLPLPGRLPPSAVRCIEFFTR